MGFLENLEASIFNVQNKVETNLTWDEDSVWKGWTYSPERNRYYFDDIGNESLTGLWSDDFLNQAF